MAKRVNRDPERERRWRGIIQRQAASGMSIRAFCRQGKRKESAFYYWRAELRRRDKPNRPKPADASGPATAAFVPVVVSDPMHHDSVGIEILLPGGARVRVAGGVDREALAGVLAALRQAGFGAAAPAGAERSC
jgi:transposase